MNDFADPSRLVEDRIHDHHISTTRSGKAPLLYRLHPLDFDSMARRLAVKTEFGDRQPNGTRPEFITRHFSTGSVRVYCSGDVSAGFIEKVEHESERDIACGDAEVLRRLIEVPEPSTERPISSWLGLDSRGGRLIVGMNEERRPEGVLNPGEFVDISSRPHLPWRAERLCVWSRCASSFFIHDVKIGNRSFFANCYPIPADAFSTRLDQLAVIDEALKRDGALALTVKKGGIDVLGMPFVLPTVQPGTDVSIRVEHIGTEPMRFVAGFFGTTAV